jgi:cell division septum initiation protein DivIVA
MADKEKVLQSVFGMIDRLVEKASEYANLEEENEKLQLGLANREEEIEDLQSALADMKEELEQFKSANKRNLETIENLAKLLRESEEKFAAAMRVRHMDMRSAYPDNLQGAGATSARMMREAGLRSNPCIEKATEGEPTFTLRAKDTLAPEVVREWAFRAKQAGSPKEKTDDARRIADEMEDWQIANQRHVPD